MSADVDTQTMDFQSEVRQLLDLVIHSLYGNKEVFLRELVSNASDALDKLRFQALADESLYEGDAELGIHIDVSDTLGTVTISDNGIGMSRDDVVQNLGTIARSGTREFFSRLTGDQKKDSQLIGQFGVGFYSAFIVADRVTVVSRAAGADQDEAVRWESDGRGEFTVQTVRRKRRGTEVTLHLKEDEKEFLQAMRLQGILRRYSDHIAWPITMPGEKGEERVNSATALWSRNKKDITDEEYEEFYKHIAHDFEPPMARLHSRVEGSQEYTTLFFIPSRAPFDLFDRETRHGVKLYVKRVFIMDDAEQLLPRYLRFVRGVVDSADLPLNVSREILQSSRSIDSIRAASVKRLLGLFEDMAGDPERWGKFWPLFGRVLKEGVVEDDANRERLAKLLRFCTTTVAGDEQTRSLADYVAGMKAGQKHIYYATGDSLAALRNSPHLEVFARHGVEVILMTDPIDEWLVGHLNEFEGKALKSISKGELDLADLGEAAPEQAATADAACESLLGRLRESLGEQVKDVRVSGRLTNSPACLVAEEHEMGAHLERILRAAGQEVPAGRAVLEINPGHALIERIQSEQEAGRFDDWAKLLLEQSVLAEGGRLDAPGEFVSRLNRLLEQPVTGAS